MSAESQLLGLILAELRQVNERQARLEQLLAPKIHPPAPAADAAPPTTPKRRAKKAK